MTHPDHPGYIKTFKRPRTDNETRILRELSLADGDPEFVRLQAVCFTLGQLLQAVPKEARKGAVLRLHNVAKANRQNGEPPVTYLALEALIAGWEDASHVPGSTVAWPPSDQID